MLGQASLPRALSTTLRIIGTCALALLFYRVYSGLAKNRGSDMSNLTTSEIMFERWCREHGIPFRRIKVARAQGHKRPDYAIKVNGGWCVVEVKEIDPTAEDDRLYQQIASNRVEGRWVDAGARLRKPIRDASDQLRKFSVRGFPTAVCLVDNTVGFYVEPFQVIQAMCGKATVRIAVSDDPEYEARFLGMHHGKKATMTGQHNTSISAVAVLRQPSGSPHSLISITTASPECRLLGTAQPC
jgi:hypothetical protein